MDESSLFWRILVWPKEEWRQGVTSGAARGSNTGDNDLEAIYYGSRSPLMFIQGTTKNAHRYAQEELLRSVDIPYVQGISDTVTAGQPPRNISRVSMWCLKLDNVIVLP